ncbi:MAG: VanW family protein [Oscillospiraceae bacterium]|nr:VanW family protein [Oscillospiraceae bacterium]
MNEKKVRKVNTKILVIILSLAIIAAAFTLIAVFSKISTTYKKVYINDICAGGKNVDEVKKLLSEKYVPENTNVIFSYKNNDFEVNGKDFDLIYDLDKTSENAHQTGRSKNAFLRGINAIRYSIFKKEIPVEITFDQDKLYDILSTKTTDVENPVTNTVIELKDDKLAISNGKKGNGVDIDKIKKEVEKIISKNLLTEKTEIKITEIEPRIPTAKALYEKYHKEPKDVEFGEKDGEVYFSEHITGVDFDVDAAQKILNENKNSSEVYYIPVEITQPQKTTQWFIDNRLTDTLGSFSTIYNAGNYDRSHNIALAAQKINGMVLMPGEQFSFNGVVGQRSAQTGFKTAKVYQGGEIVDGIGGGICQVSTTLYNAVLYADLSIDYRTNHSMPVSYAPAGRDATVSYGSIDFKFSNNQGYPIKLSCSASGGKLICSVYGINLKHKKVEITTQTISTTPFSVKEVEDNTLPEGTRKVKQAGSAGSVVDTFKTVYINGESQGTKKISRSNYSAITQIELVGTKKEDENISDTPAAAAFSDGETYVGDDTAQ